VTYKFLCLTCGYKRDACDSLKCLPPPCPNDETPMRRVTAK